MHEWRTMDDDDEVYPATSGQICTRCGEIRLGWFGHAPEETAPLLRQLRIEYIEPDCLSMPSRL